MGQSRPLLVYFCSFLHDKYSTITINDKSFDGVLGTRTRGSRMVGADESTELWRHPYLSSLYFLSEEYFEKKDSFQALVVIILKTSSLKLFSTLLELLEAL